MTAATIPDGIVHDLPEAEYHALPGLSSTGMKAILRSPLHYRQQMDHRVEKAEFDVGHAAHAKILGVGMKLVAIPEWMLSKNGSTGTNAARDFIAVARAAGQVPVKAAVLAEVDAMAEAVLAHPKASRLLQLPGAVEVSLFGTDPTSGVRLRGRVDKLGELPGDGVVNVDLKTTPDVRRHKLARIISELHYDVQSEAYRHLLRINGLNPAPTHLIFVEKTPPHEVRVVSLAHPDWIEVGSTLMRRAIELYAQCTANDTWPGDDHLPGPAEAIEPPGYYLHANDMELDDEMEF